MKLKRKINGRRKKIEKEGEVERGIRTKEGKREIVNKREKKRETG
jgi:hypothetical protein